MKKIEKGLYGYIRSQKCRRTCFTLISLLVPVIIFIIGLIVNDKRENMFTFVAIMSCLPGCRLAVGMIMMFLQKSISEEAYKKTKESAGVLPQLYEMVFTAYEKTTSVDCLVLGTKSIIGYSSNPKTSPEYIEKHLTEILDANGYKRTVKIFTDFPHFEARIKDMASLDSALEAAEKNQKVVDVLKAIAL